MADLGELEQRRTELYAQLAAVGDFRAGSINETWRRCGKPNCACAREGNPGHGPRYLWTRSAGGRTRGHQLAAGPELEKARAEVARYGEFTALAGQIVAVNEAICEARPVTPPGVSGLPDQGAGKGGSPARSRPTSPRR
jgi:hypothetical protein